MVNAISYSECTFIDISVSRNDKEIVVTLAYDGKEFDPTHYEPRKINSEMPSIGGKGIKLMMALTDKVEYRRTDNKNIIIFTKWKQNIK